MDEKIQQLYNPKVMRFEPPLDKSVVKREYSNVIMGAYGLISMYTSIKRSYEMMEAYAQEHGIVYDAIVRLRYDAILDAFPDLNTLDLSKIHWPYDKRVENLLNHTWFGPLNLVKPMFLILDYMDELNDAGTRLCDEDLTYACAKRNGLLTHIVFPPRHEFRTDRIFRNEKRNKVWIGFIGLVVLILCSVVLIAKYIYKLNLPLF